MGEDMCLMFAKTERLLHDLPPPSPNSVQPMREVKMMTLCLEQVCGAACRAGVVAVVLMMCSASVTGMLQDNKGVL